MCADDTTRDADPDLDPDPVGSDNIWPDPDPDPDPLKITRDPDPDQLIFSSFSASLLQQLSDILTSFKPKMKLEKS